jgi:peptidyl-tRNA hydrolase, PTH1 family
MKLFVGLGNPGDKYAKNRHNVGFIILDEYSSEAGFKWVEDKKFKCVKAEFNGNYYIKPQTFMNNSGESVSIFANFYKISPENITVIHDDVDLELCRIKSQKGASSAGHRGVESIIEKLGTDEFNRVRIGIGRDVNKKIATEDWVLMDFSEEELARIKEISHLLQLS